MSNPFREFVSHILGPLSFSAGEVQFFGQMRSFSGKYTEFAKILDSYPEKKLSFLESANEAMKGKLKDELTSTSAALSMVGYIPSRNFIMASIIHQEMKILNPTSPEVPKALPYALKSEQLNAEL